MHRPTKHRKLCLSALVFDQLLVGETDGLESARLHLAECSSCRAHLELLEAARDATLTPPAVTEGVDAIMRSYEAEQQSAKIVSINKYKLATWAGIGLAAAASVALIIGIVQPTRVDNGSTGGHVVAQPDGIRLKGASVFQVLVVHQGKGRVLRDRDTASIGDVLAFRVSVDRLQYVSIASIGEQAEQGADFLDHEQTAPWKVMPGSIEQLPVSAVLDGQSGNDRVYALFCDSPRAPVAVLKEIERLYPATKQNRRDLVPERVPAVKNCNVKTYLVRRNGVGD